ncbi:MAG: DUF3592 domain-containing protein [Pirellulales bacterium]|nr:DUF3592 domain-containing protein [Pirellulales bacterium]
MPRAFPLLYPKKRGHRRTGSKTLGSVGELVFFGIFFLAGVAGLILILLTVVVPEWRVNHEFRANQATVLPGSRIGVTPGEDGPLYRPEIHVKHTVEGVDYGVWTYDIAGGYTSGRAEKEAVLKCFPVGGRVACWYDPLDPNTVVLVRGYSWWTILFLIVPAVFLFMGAAGLIFSVLHWGKSAERRAVRTQKAQQGDSSNGNGENVYPSVPVRTDITNSPGTRLRYRLPIEASPGWAVFGMLLLVLLWNAGVAVMVCFAVGGHLSGGPDWPLTLFCIPFALVGLFLIYVFFRKLLIATGIGPTLLEISEHPLYPGEEYQVFLSQTGRLKVNALTLSLVCEERATYQQGTNTRTETRPVFKQELFRREQFEIPPGLPFETETRLQVPLGAMHSFKSEHNEIQWTLVAEGDIAGWPDYKRAFPVLIYPPDGGSRA